MRPIGRRHPSLRFRGPTHGLQPESHRARPTPAQRELPAAMSNDSNQSFDRMRGMLVRAAELRDSEQQQIFDSLDEIHARLAGLDAIGTVRKRLSELPDRTEVGVLAERLDEAVAKLDAQDGMLGALVRALEVLPDKL